MLTLKQWFRGIHHTISIPLNKTMTSRDIRNLYQERYAGEKLVKVVGDAPVSFQTLHSLLACNRETDKVNSS